MIMQFLAQWWLCAHQPGMPWAHGGTVECVLQVLSYIKVSPCRWCVFNLQLSKVPDFLVSLFLDGRWELRTSAKLPAG